MTEDASVVSAPLVKGAAANIECRALTSFPASNYVVYLAEVVAFKVDDKTVPVAWYMDKYYALEKGGKVAGSAVASAGRVLVVGLALEVGNSPGATEPHGHDELFLQSFDAAYDRVT